MDNIDYPPTPGSLRAMDSHYYDFLGGGARLKLLETFFELQIPELLGAEGDLAAHQICQKLGLNLDRGWKFLHLLALTGLLEEKNGLYAQDDTKFGLSECAKYYFGDNGTEGYFFRDLVNFWKQVAELSLTNILRGAALPENVDWPYASLESIRHFEYFWMRLTAPGSIHTLLVNKVVDGGNKLLDVGGGDGTVGCALCTAYPELEVTVFNLPTSADLARKHISERQMNHRVKVVDGDFLRDELPVGYDIILFNRTLADWSADTCKMLFVKARKSLLQNGKIIINEALLDGNVNFTIAWEFRYIFYDSYGRALFKPLAVYRDLLKDTGFNITRIIPMADDSFYSIIEAMKD